ncbi:hypothetical protein ACJJJB_01440 [Microbulbifer sp. ANSA001]|uniref:hypothetical protein n=1 Tax=Microbulbifer sp. ANSA001 TaxID=3243358 RepID=UPI00404198CC
MNYFYIIFLMLLSISSLASNDTSFMEVNNNSSHEKISKIDSADQSTRDEARMGAELDNCMSLLRDKAVAYASSPNGMSIDKLVYKGSLDDEYSVSRTLRSIMKSGVEEISYFTLEAYNARYGASPIPNVRDEIEPTHLIFIKPNGNRFSSGLSFPAGRSGDVCYFLEPELLVID